MIHVYVDTILSAYGLTCIALDSIVHVGYPASDSDEYAVSSGLLYVQSHVNSPKSLLVCHDILNGLSKYSEQ